MLSLLWDTSVAASRGNPTTAPSNKSSNTAKPTPSWWDRVVVNAGGQLGYAMEAVHEGSGWILGKAKVNIEQVGESRKTELGSVADFSITVSSSDETFTHQVKDIPCNELGVPTEVSQQRFDETVDQIKKMLSRFQD